ncbi:MAG: FlgD immunoglobulin-like domain containing protein [Candidatus Krumholzibacteriia bacterium]
MSIRRLFILASLALVAVTAVIAVPRLRHLPPRPTEHRLDRDAERRNEDGRRAWLEAMHRTAPGVDWRAIERDNGRVLQERRNADAGRRDQDDRWREVGSRNQAGRMHTAAVSVLGDSLYGGSSRGGVWKGSLDGQGWRPLGDNLWGGSHGLAIAGAAGDVITSITDDGGLHCSDDEGVTWLAPLGVPASFNLCKRVARDAGDPDRVLLLARSGGSLDLYASRDAGRSYLQVRHLASGVGDFWLDRRTGGAVYLVDGNRLYRSDTSLIVWSDLGTLPVAPVSNVVLTGSEAGAPTLYAAVRVSNQWRLYRSVTAGTSWAERDLIEDFWETLCASSVNPDLVAFAGVELWRSTDGGGSFAKVNNWWDYYDDPLHKLHADFPGLDCIPLAGGGETWYADTDGGLFRSDDGLVSVTNISLSGLGVSQYYGTLTSVNDPELVLAGAQDQGYQRSTGPGRGPTWDFVQLVSGDYGHLTSSDGSHGIVYSVYPGFVLVQQGEQAPILSGYLDFPANEAYGWLPFIVADPDNARSFYFCGARLHKASWLGGDQVFYTPSSQLFTTAGGNYLTAFGISPADHQKRLAVVDNGRIWHTADGGQQWRLSPDTGPSAHYFYGTAIVHSAGDPDRAWIGGSGYGGHPVWRTADGGETWDGAGSGLPATLVYGLALESPTSDVVYAATEAGPYRLDPATDLWEYIGGATAPLTTYWCVEAVPAAQVVRFGTYGRGIWDYSVRTTTEAPQDQVPGADLQLTCAPNPFNPRTTVSFTLGATARATVTVRDASGRRVRVLCDETLGAGRHALLWNGRDQQGRDCPSGVYLVDIAAAGARASRQVSLVR